MAQFQYYTIPTPPGYGIYSFNINLFGYDYKIKLAYNYRGGFWALSLYNAEGTARIRGRKMVPNWPILSRLPQARTRYGLLMLLGEDKTNVPYLFDDLGEKLVFTFVTG